MRAMTAISLVILALLAAGCGSSGGDGPSPTPPAAITLFSGDYFQLMVGGQSQPANSGIAAWGTTTADGAGTYNWTVTQNLDGSITPSASPLDQVYTIAADRSVAWMQGATARWRGGISPTGDVMGTANIAPLAPGAMIHLKKGSGLATTDLDGMYHFAGFGFVGAGLANQATWGTTDFDGSAGDGDVIWYANEEGDADGTGTDPLAFSVAGDGQLDLTVHGASYQGGVLPGGELAVVAGGVSTDDEPFLIAFLPQSSAATTATFSGSYFVVGIERDPGDPIALVLPVNRTYSGTVQVDGVGGLAPTLRRNEEDAAPLSTSPLWGGYTVDPDGALTITAEPGVTLVGGVSADGRFAVVAGGTANDTNPVVYLFFK